LAVSGESIRTAALRAEDQLGNGELFPFQQSVILDIFRAISIPLDIAVGVPISSCG
jgi:hypothetical protein